MTLDITFFVFAIPAVFISGISKGGFGSGAGFAVTIFLALILEPAQALGLMLPLLMAMDIGALRAYWKKWDRADTRALILGGVPGVLLGAALFKLTNPDALRFSIGILAVVFVSFQFATSQGWIKRATRPMPNRAGLVAGAIAGFTSFISHAGGPPASIYLLSKKLDKTTYQATTVATFWAINVMKFVPYAALGVFTKETILGSIYLLPIGMLGMAARIYLHKRVS